VMKMEKEQKQHKYTCNEYREEMILAGLQKRLQQNDLSETEREQLLQDINELEKKMGL
jgi:hypothetical protein